MIRRKIYEPKTAKDVFRIIRKFSETAGPSETSIVYDVFAGIRGPDKETDYVLKGPETCVIRAALFKASSIPGTAIPLDTEDMAKYRREYQYRGEHFAEHSRNAFDALGLNWSEPNGRVDLKFLPKRRKTKKVK